MAVTLTPRDLTPERLKQMRLDRDWSQEDLAARLGIKRTTVSLWESGKRPVSRELALRCCAIMDSATALKQGRDREVTQERLKSLQKTLTEDGHDWQDVGYETCRLGYFDILNSLVVTLIEDPDGASFRVFAQHFQELTEAKRLNNVTSVPNVASKVKGWAKGKGIYKMQPGESATVTQSLTSTGALAMDAGQVQEA